MASKIAWALVLVLVLALGASFFIVLKSDNARIKANADREAALKAKEESETAAKIALAARQAAEAAKQQSDEVSLKLKADLDVAQKQAAEIQAQLPKYEADLAAARTTLAEALRGNTTATAAPSTPAKAVELPKHRTDGWSVPELLPPETLGLLTIRDVPATLAKGKETGLWRVLSSPEFERVFRLPLGRLQGYMTFAELMLGEKIATLADYVSQGEITFAVMSLDKRMPNGAPLADVLLSIQLRDKADAFMAEFNKRLDQFKASTGGRLTSEQVQIGNTTVTQLRTPDAPFALNCALCDGTFLICLGDGRIQQLLAMREKNKASKDNSKTLPGKAPEVLAQVETFKRAQAKAGPDSDLFLWSNLAAIFANPIINARELTDTQRHELEVSGVKDIKAISLSVGVKGAGLRESLYLDVPAASRKGVLALIDGESADLKQLYAAPRNALLAWTFKITPDKLLDKVVELASLDNPKAREDAAVGLLFLGEQLKIDVKKDLLEALTGQGLFSLCVPSINTKLPLAFPQPLLTLQLKNKDGFANFLSALATAAMDKVQFTETMEGGKKIMLARQREAEPGKEPFQLCYTIDGNDLLVSLYPLAVRSELRRRASTAPGTKLDGDADFNLARANLGYEPQALLYVDTAALFTALYDVAIPVLQYQQKFQQIDLNALPTSDLLYHNLGCALVSMQFQADGIALDSYSPMGTLGLLVPVAAAGGRMALNRAVDRNINPELDARKSEALGKVSRDLTAYAAEHKGNFPKTLDEMKPKYLQDLGEELPHIIYLGKQKGDNRIVAHSSDKLPGPVTVLLQNGNIQTIRRSQLGKILREGVTEAAKNEAVKPPKPPDF